MKRFDPYIPRTDGELAIWATTYKEKIGLLGASLGLSPEKVVEQQRIAQALVDNIKEVSFKKASLREAAAAKKLFQKTYLKEIRRTVRYMKTKSGYARNIGEELGVVGKGKPVDLTNIKPVLRPASELGKVAVRFVKDRMFGIRLYGRMRGEEQWKYLGGARRSPYIDKTPLTKEGQPEIREYYAICYDGIHEIGFPSDMVSVVHAG